MASTVRLSTSEYLAQVDDGPIRSVTRFAVHHRLDGASVAITPLGGQEEHYDDVEIEQLHTGTRQEQIAELTRDRDQKRAAYEHAQRKLNELTSQA